MTHHRVPGGRHPRSVRFLLPRKVAKCYRVVVVNRLALVGCLLGLILPCTGLAQNTAENFVKSGDAKFLKGDYDGAIAEYNSAIELDPKYAPAYDQRGGARIEKGEYDEAITDCNKAIELDLKNPYAYNHRGAAKRLKGDYDGAIADYDKAIDLNPKFVSAYDNRGYVKRLKGDFDGAIADCTKAIEVKPEFFPAYNNRGYAKALKGDLDGAIADCTEAIRLYPKFAGAYASRAWAEIEKHSYEAAMADSNKAIELNPKFGTAYEDRALIRELKGDRKGALDDLLQSEAIASTRVPSDSHLHVWVMRARQGNTAEANKELSAYLDKHRNGTSADWPSHIGDFLVGTTSESDFLAAAVAPEPKKNRDQQCQGWYFAAVKRLLAGDKKMAADYFEKCLATDAYGLHEYVRATFELKALGVAPVGGQ